MTKKKKISCKIAKSFRVDFEGNPELIQKFSEYHIKHWNEMPCFRGSTFLPGEKYSSTYFFEEALPKVREFCEENDIDITDIEDFKEFEEKCKK
jgi:hypothetical protein